MRRRPPRSPGCWSTPGTAGRAMTVLDQLAAPDERASGGPRATGRTRGRPAERRRRRLRRRHPARRSAPRCRACPTTPTTTTGSSPSARSAPSPSPHLAPAPGRAAVGRRGGQRVDRDRVAARPPDLPRGRRRARPRRGPPGSSRTPRRSACPRCGSSRQGARTRWPGCPRRTRSSSAAGSPRPGVLDACWAALRPGGRLVANAVTLESEAVLVAGTAALGGELARLAVAARGAGRRVHRLAPGDAGDDLGV